MLENVKKHLKTSRLARDLNSAIKGSALDAAHAINRLRFGDYWNQYSSNDSNQIALKLLERRLFGLERNKRTSKLNIFFVGTYYDHEMQGFFQGLQRLGDIHTYVNAHGEYGINTPSGVNLSLDGHRQWCQHLYESVLEDHRVKPIDFIIGTFTAPSVSLDVLLAIRSLGIPIINYGAMDDMLPTHWRSVRKVQTGAFGLGPAVDLTLHTTPEIIPRYLKEGYPAIYFPFASDADIFRPAAERDIDVLFIGNCYGKREKLIGKCLDAGIRVEAYGKDFPRGHITGKDVPSLFGRSKIILGSGLVGHSAKLTTLKLRDFDGPMAGALYLTSHNSLLANHFNINKEIVTYTSVDDCIRKIKYFLKNEMERSRIAANGRKRSCFDHTWDHRFKLLIKTLGYSSKV
jgi:spore maturation protein CgeB